MAENLYVEERVYSTRSIIHLYKRKENPQVCQPQKHLPPVHCWEDTGKILLNRLNVHLDQKRLMPESQCGFRKDRGTIDMIFTAR